MTKYHLFDFRISLHNALYLLKCIQTLPKTVAAQSA